MMAQPSVLWAKDAPNLDPLSATDGAPVLLIPVHQNGQDGYLAVAAVPWQGESALVTDLATKKADELILAVDGPQDPALDAAKKGGRFSSVRTFFLNSKIAAGKLKDKMAAKVGALTEFCKREKAGFMFAFYNASVMSGFTYYASSSVESGLAVLSGLFIWNSFLITQPHRWEHTLSLGGEKVRDVAAKAVAKIGREMTEEEKRYYEVAGQFLVAWGANIAVASHVLYNSGHLDSFTQAAFYGLLINYNIWDAVILKKVKAGALTEKFAKRYFAFQFFVGTLFEAASYLHLPYSQWILGATVVSGLTYLLQGDRIERGVQSARAAILKRLVAKPCEFALMPFMPEAYE